MQRKIAKRKCVNIHSIMKEFSSAHVLDEEFTLQMYESALRYVAETVKETLLATKKEPGKWGPKWPSVQD